MHLEPCTREDVRRKAWTSVFLACLLLFVGFGAALVDMVLAGAW